MKRKKSTEPDLYVINKKPTVKELDVMTAIINNYNKEKPIAQGRPKQQPNTKGKNKELSPEPIEIDLYVSPKKMTANERKELGEYIENFKRKKANKNKPK